jgi:hypothetical protein
MIYFNIEEEFGFRDWVWAFPGTPAEALAEWKAGRRPLHGNKTGFLGTIHQVGFIPVWRNQPDFHCKDKRRWEFCFPCQEVQVEEFQGSDLVPFPAITNYTQFAGEGHVHEEDDTYLDVKGVGHFHDRHAKCPVGCESCWTCQAHTRSMSDKDYKCAVCEKPLCTVCSGCAETAFCTEHSVVDAIGLLEDS